MCKITLDDLGKMDWFEWQIRRFIENDDYEIVGLEMGGVGDGKAKMTIIQKKKEDN